MQTTNTQTTAAGAQAATGRYVNIAAYKFISFDDTEAMRPQFQALCQQLNLKGTILLTPEGINMFLSGLPADIEAYLAWLRKDPRFADIEVKFSYSDEQSHKRMLVKIKQEIITMRMPLIKPELGRAPAVDAATLKRWLDQGHDDNGKPVVMVDTRNDFEVDVGTFDNTVDYRIAKFTEFPEVIAAHKDDFAGKTVVTFCTGGIRCEILSALMKNRGFEEVYQIDGGIVRYGEKFGNKGLWEGSLYVFDKRMHMEFGDGVEDEDYVQLGHCVHCGKPTNTFQNCINEDTCRRQVLICDDCWEHTETQHCGREDCKEVAEGLAAAN